MNYGDKDLLYDLHNYGANIDRREIFRSMKSYEVKEIIEIYKEELNN